MFITFEGPEACGKSTQASMLYTKLVSMGVPCLLTKEPGSSHSEICTTLRSLIFKPDITEETALFCFLADRSQHIRTVIRPALDEGKVVISDRSSLSTIVYHLAQKNKQPINWEYVHKLMFSLDLAQQIKPDLCFLATADYNWTVNQLNARPGLDRIELLGKDFHLRIHELFNDLCITSSSFYENISSKMELFPREVVALPKADANSLHSIHDFIFEKISSVNKELK